MVNYVRKSVETTDAAAVVKSVHAALTAGVASALPWNDDRFLLPVRAP